MILPDYKSAPIAVIGFGYVGLPLAVEFGKVREVIGFDVNERRIKALQRGKDTTRDVDPDELQMARHLAFSSDTRDLRRAKIFHLFFDLKSVFAAEESETRL